jgi:hypothetical protein
MSKRLFFLLFLSLSFLCHDVKAQTAVNVNSVRCPGTNSTGIIIPVGTSASLGGTPIVVFSCMQLDSASFSFDATTTPPTVRLKPSAPTTITILPHVEVPTGAINGTNASFTLSTTPASSYPVLVYRNGLLLTQCATTTLCNGDYQLSATMILFLNASQTASGVNPVPNAGDLVQVLYWHQ